MGPWEKKGAALGVLLLLASCGKDGASPRTGLQSERLASLVISDGPVYDFGAQEKDTEHEKLFVLTNQGDARATGMTSTFYLSVNFSFKGGDYPGTGGTCGESLDARGSCIVVVEFSPKYKGTFSDYMRVNYFDGSSRRLTDRPELRGQGL